MLTPYGEKFSGEDILPQYPRPQLIRDSYLNLNGPWDYAFTAGEEPAQYDGQILVPFPPESPLSGVEKALGPEGALWYRRAFRLPEGFRRGPVLLHFGAVDQEAEVFCNGQLALTHAGGYTGFWADITELLTEGDGENILTVRVRDRLTSGPCSYGGQKRYTAWSGIWQTVWCESVPDGYVSSLRIVPLPEENVLEVTVNPGGSAGEGDACTVTVDGVEYALAAGQAGRIPTDGLELWSPETPRLYGMQVSLGKDLVHSYFALRSLTLRRDSQGHRRFFLNGSPIFFNGVLYQGLWPDGLSTPPTDEALLRDVKAVKAMGFNAIRLRDKVECPRFYWHCDRLGVMVLQGLPAGGRPGLPPLPGVRDNSHALFGRKDADSRNQFKRELRETAQQLMNAPSVVIWELFDEGRGQFDTDSLCTYLDELDGTRLIDRASGGVDQGYGVFKSVHSLGPRLRLRADSKGRALLLSACGGLGNRTEGHCWSAKNTANVLYDSPQRLAFAVQELFDQIRDQAGQGLAGSVFCQLTDVEAEVTGFLTYDRKRYKIPPVHLRKMIQIPL